jgi:hypothetical protein
MNYSEFIHDPNMNYELNYESSKIIHLIHCGDLVAVRLSPFSGLPVAPESFAHANVVYIMPLQAVSNCAGIQTPRHVP